MDNKFAFLALRGWRARGLDVLVGALAILGHAPFHIWPVTLGCFIYLFLRLDRMPAGITKPGFGRGFWFALGYFAASTYWIMSAFVARGPEFIWLAPPMVFGLATLMAFFWGVAGGLFTRVKPKGIVRSLFFVSLVFLAEFARGHVFGGFPWNLPGYIFKAGGAFSQFASVGGVYGLSFAVLLVVGLIAGASGTRKPVLSYAGAGLIMASLWGFGAWRLSGANIKYVEGPLLRIVKVQFDQKDQFNPDKSMDIINQFLTQSIAPGLENVTHIIWPEGAVGGLAVENTELIRVMGELMSRDTATPPIWLLNSLRHEIKPNNNGEPQDIYYNTLAAIEFDTTGVATIIGYNDKVRLVPFGEFIPGEDMLKSFGPKSLSTSLFSMTPGLEKLTSTIKGLPRVSPQICYEIIFSGLTPQSPRPDWILNQSNDAWYGNSLGPRQHANIAQYRAIEEGVPVIRSASNGISGSIDPYGRFLEKVDIQETRSLDVRLPVSIKETVFFANFNWFLLLLNLLPCIIYTMLTCYKKPD